MNFVKVAEIQEFTAVAKKKVEVNGIEILLVRKKDVYYAVSNRCPHMGGSLYDGKIEGDAVFCPKHGSGFNLKTGEVVEQGKLLFIKVKVNQITTFPVKIEGNEIFIGIESKK